MALWRSGVEREKNVCPLLDASMSSITKHANAEATVTQICDNLHCHIVFTEPWRRGDDSIRHHSQGRTRIDTLLACAARGPCETPRLKIRCESRQREAATDFALEPPMNLSSNSSQDHPWAVEERQDTAARLAASQARYIQSHPFNSCRSTPYHSKNDRGRHISGSSGKA